MPVGCAVAVAVAVIAMPTGAARRIRLDGRVHDRERFSDGGIVRGHEAEAHELQESSIDHGALIEGWAAVADVVADGGVGGAGLREANEIGVRRQWPVPGDSPAFDRALPVVGDAVPDVRAG